MQEGHKIKLPSNTHANTVINKAQFAKIKKNMKENFENKYNVDPKISKFLEEFSYEKSGMAYLAHFNLDQINEIALMVNTELKNMLELSTKQEKFYDTLREYKITQISKGGNTVKYNPSSSKDSRTGYYKESKNTDTSRFTEASEARKQYMNKHNDPNFRTDNLTDRFLDPFTTHPNDFKQMNAKEYKLDYINKFYHNRLSTRSNDNNLNNLQQQSEITYNISPTNAKTTKANKMNLTQAFDNEFANYKKQKEINGQVSVGGKGRDLYTSKLKTRNNVLFDADSKLFMNEQGNTGGKNNNYKKFMKENNRFKAKTKIPWDEQQKVTHKEKILPEGITWENNLRPRKLEKENTEFDKYSGVESHRWGKNFQVNKYEGRRLKTAADTEFAYQERPLNLINVSDSTSLNGLEEVMKRNNNRSHTCSNEKNLNFNQYQDTLHNTNEFIENMNMDSKNKFSETFVNSATKSKISLEKSKKKLQSTHNILSIETVYYCRKLDVHCQTVYDENGVKF